MTRINVALALLLATTAVTGESQENFGRAVAISGLDALVLKPFAARGPAAVKVFRDRAGSWEQVAELLPGGALETGERFSISLVADDNLFLVGGGDADALWAAEPFMRSNADWLPGERIPLAEPPDPAERKQLDLQGIFAILQPANRTVSLAGDLAAVALMAGPANPAGLVILRRDAADGWSEEARLAAPEGSAGFGTAVAVAEGRVYVSAPRQDGGVVYLYQRDSDSGSWALATRLDAEGLSAGRLGTSLAVTADGMAAGAPGQGNQSGAVVVWRPMADGTWIESDRLGTGADSTGDRFGAALAVSGDEMLIGAPGAADGAGMVHRYRSGETGWQVSGDPVAGLEGYNFGVAVALSGDLVVVGASGAEGGRGRAAIYRRADDGSWGDPSWVGPGGDLAAVTGGRVLCESGAAAGFECDNVDLESYLPATAFGGAPGERVSDLWGWTDPDTGREYALVGRVGGLAMIDITDPSSPVYLGSVPANNSGARDIKVYKDHAFFTGDGAGDHGLIVFDLTRLRTVEQPGVLFEPDAVYREIASAHNLIVDTEAGYAYPVAASGGGQTCGGGLHMVNIQDPKNPTFAGCYTDTEGLIYAGRTHDGQCVVYDGPDEEFLGREICFASNETAIRIVDVTDKENPVPLAAGTYPGLSYVHQGWLTDDHRYFYLDDELDELVGQAGRTRTLIWDVAELDDPVFVGEYFGPDGASDHNLYVKGDRMYQANYQAGLRVVDISDRHNPVEVGYFDTTPYGGNPPGFDGAWTAYPFFESGTVLVSSMQEGLFILRPRPPAPVP